MVNLSHPSELSAASIDECWTIIYSSDSASLGSALFIFLALNK